MDRTEVAKLRKTILKTGIVYICIIAVIVSMAAGFSLMNIIGLMLGFGSMMVNIILLEKVVVIFRRPDGRVRGVLLYLLRLIIYGSVALLCYKIGTTALLCFGGGVLALIPGAVVFMLKEGRLND